MLPARAAKPRDKAAVEGAVLIVERSVLAPLRDQQFFSLVDLNTAMRPLRDALNARPFQKREDNRQIVFEQVERATLKPLPLRAYEHAIWKKAKVNLDYHVEHDRRYYSVPYTLVGKTVDLRITEHTVEMLHRSQRITTHLLGKYKGKHTTEPSHRPTGHQSIVDLTHTKLLTQAEGLGESVVEVIRAQYSRRRHPDATIRTSQGILRLAKDYGVEALEDACRRALWHKTFSYRAIVGLLKAPQTPRVASPPPLDHDNVRGADYFLVPTPC